ncbi:hypothetical protein JOS77_26965 [Chromobacterium haemolyticum]|nr:hypothetical protein JOS77_26965 [Chromobacterium haemolyticum]
MARRPTLPATSQPAPPTAPPRTVPESSTPTLPGETGGATSETGRRSTPENQIRAIYRQFHVDYDLRATIQDIRKMDLEDGRVKRIHAMRGWRGTSPAVAWCCCRPTQLARCVQNGAVLSAACN